MNDRPTSREPEIGAPVSAVVDEFEILAIRNELRRELEWLDEHAMGGRLVVEAETGVGVADGVKTFGHGGP